MVREVVKSRSVAPESTNNFPRTQVQVSVVATDYSKRLKILSSLGFFEVHLSA